MPKNIKNAVFDKFKKFFNLRIVRKKVIFKISLKNDLKISKNVKNGIFKRRRYFPKDCQKLKNAKNRDFFNLTTYFIRIINKNRSKFFHENSFFAIFKNFFKV